MAAQEVLVDAAERGFAASGSEKERKDLIKTLPVFKTALLAQIRDDDVAGVMALSYTLRDGKDLGGGVVLTLGDRALIGWMKGLLKKPVVEAVLFSSITSVEQGVRPPGGRIRSEHPILMVEAESRWEILYSPDVPAEAPLYGLLADLLAGRQKADQLPPLGSQVEDQADRV
jgi:hypothetical protein